MKTYIYKLTSVQHKIGQKLTAKVYRIVKNTPVYLGERIYHSGSCKGAQSEVFTFLFHVGEVTKKQFDKHGGYYVNVPHNPSPIKLIEI